MLLWNWNESYENKVNEQMKSALKIAILYF